MMIWRAHIHHSWEMCVSSLDQKVLLLGHNFRPCAAILEPSCYFWTKHWFQEFGISRPPTHRVVFRSFPLFVCRFKTNKQTLYVLAFLFPHCPVQYFSGTRLTLCYILYVTSVQSLIHNMFSIQSLLKLLSNAFSTAHPSRDLRRFVLELFCQLEGRFINCKSINDWYWMRVCQTCKSPEKREVGIVKCAKKKGFWTIQCVGGWTSTTPLSFDICSVTFVSCRLEHVLHQCLANYEQMLMIVSYSVGTF